MVAKRASETEDLRTLKREKPAMTPEESTLLKQTAENQERAAVAFDRLEKGHGHILDRLEKLDEEMAMSMNYGERLSQLETQAGEGLSMIHGRTQMLDQWQHRAMQEFEKCGMKRSGFLRACVQRMKSTGKRS